METDFHIKQKLYLFTCNYSKIKPEMSDHDVVEVTLSSVRVQGAVPKFHKFKDLQNILLFYTKLNIHDTLPWHGHYVLWICEVRNQLNWSFFKSKEKIRNATHFYVSQSGFFTYRKFTDFTLKLFVVGVFLWILSILLNSICGGQTRSQDRTTHIIVMAHFIYDTNRGNRKV